MKQDNEKKPLKWWITLIIAVLTAIGGALAENTTNLIGSVL